MLLLLPLGPLTCASSAIAVMKRAPPAHGVSDGSDRVRYDLEMYVASDHPCTVTLLPVLPACR